MEPARIQAEVSGVKAMSGAVRRAGILCIVLAAACACAEEPRPASSGMASFPVIGAEQTSPNEDPALARQAPEPPLDVTTLKLRLRETSALGVFAKLALRSEMSDLMEQLRWHHRGSNKTSFADLRLLYDRFVLKVLLLIQDGDPHLARAIARSQESIWRVLADPEQFESAG
jgi:hypothetical protein